mgnify:CR=1 FL=1
MFELLGAIASFIFLFILPMIAICSIPALIAGGFIANVSEKEEK